MMRNRLLLASVAAILLLWAAPCWGTITLVNTAKADTGAGTNPLPASAQNTTTGNLLVVAFGTSATTTTISGITDTAGNVYLQCAGALVHNASGGTSDIWYAANIIGNAANVTSVTLTNPGTFMGDGVMQYSGAAASNPCETAQNGATVGLQTVVTSGSFSPAASGNMNVAIGTQDQTGANNWVAGTNYTLEVNTGSGANCEVEDRANAPAGAQTASITFSGAHMTLSVASFKPAVPSGSGVGGKAGIGGKAGLGYWQPIWRRREQL